MCIRDRIHTTRVLALTEDLPVAIVIVDSETRIRAFLPSLDELVHGGLVTIEPVEVVRHVGTPVSSTHLDVYKRQPP